MEAQVLPLMNHEVIGLRLSTTQTTSLFGLECISESTRVVAKFDKLEGSLQHQVKLHFTSKPIYCLSLAT